MQPEGSGSQSCLRRRTKMQVIFRSILGAILLLGVTALSIGQVLSRPVASRESLVSHSELKASVAEAQRLVSSYKKAGKRMTEDAKRLAELASRQSAVDDLLLKEATLALSRSYKALVELRSKIGFAIVSTYQVNNSRHVADRFGWTEKQISEIDSLYKNALKVYRDIADGHSKQSSDEEVLRLLGRMERFMQTRPVYNTGRFFIIYNFL